MPNAAALPTDDDARFAADRAVPLEGLLRDRVAPLRRGIPDRGAGPFADRKDKGSPRFRHLTLQHGDLLEEPDFRVVHPAARALG